MKEVITFCDFFHTPATLFRQWLLGISTFYHFKMHNRFYFAHFEISGSKCETRMWYNAFIQKYYKLKWNNVWEIVYNNIYRWLVISNWIRLRWNYLHISHFEGYQMLWYHEYFVEFLSVSSCGKKFVNLLLSIFLDEWLLQCGLSYGFKDSII